MFDSLLESSIISFALIIKCSNGAHLDNVIFFQYFYIYMHHPLSFGHVIMCLLIEHTKVWITNSCAFNIEIVFANTTANISSSTCEYYKRRSRCYRIY